MRRLRRKGGGHGEGGDLEGVARGGGSTCKWGPMGRSVYCHKLGQPAAPEREGQRDDCFARSCVGQHTMRGWCRRADAFE